MRNEREASSTGHSFRTLAGRFTLFALVGALVACGSNGSPKPPPPGARTLQSIAVVPDAVTVPTGAQQQFAVIGSYSDNTTLPITTGIEWTSSKPSVADSSGLGMVSCTKDSTAAGTTTITATVDGHSAQATVTVTPATLTSVTVEPAGVFMPVPVLQSFTAMGHYSDGTTSPLVNVTWASSDPAIATVDDSGFAQGVKQGSVTITAKDTASGLSSTAALTITAPVLEGITVSPSVASVPAGFKRQFIVTGQYSDGSSPTLSNVTWSSSAPTVASIDPSTGLAAGVQQAAAPVTITASAGGFTTTASLTVTAAVNTVAIPPSPPFNGSLVATGAVPYMVTGLTSGDEYLVRISSTDATNDPVVLVEGYTDASFAALTCSSFTGGPPCRAGVADIDGNLFVQVSGNSGRTFTLTVNPLPVFVAGGPKVSDTVDTTETYYKVTGLTPLASFQQTFTPEDLLSDLIVYTGPQVALGPLCSTALESGPGKKCIGIAASPVAYMTVEGWLTASGTTFDLEP